MHDIGMAAFSVFFMQSPSFLAHQAALTEGPGHGRSNAHTLFGLSAVPSDNHIRSMLDGVPTGHFDGLFAEIVRTLDDRGQLAPMRRLDGRVLIALDGAAKQDCEPRAAKRWLDRVAPNYARLRPVYLGDDLYANQPMCQAIRDAGGAFLLVCKPASHKTLWESLSGVELDALTETHGRGTAKRTYRYRWMNAVPIRDSKDALAVNWLELEIVNPKGKATQRFSFIRGWTGPRAVLTLRRTYRRGSRAIPQTDENVPHDHTHVPA